MPRTEKANQQIREEQRAKILKAAANIFARKGSTATMADVASEAGISQGLAYRYFASKEEIYTILIKQAAELSGGPAERIKQIKGTPGTRLSLLITYILENNRINPGFSQIVSQVLADDTAPHELRQLVLRNGRIIQDIMRQLIFEGQATGEIANDDPDQLMVALMACINGLMKRATMLDPKDAPKNFPDAKIILRMLLNPTRRRSDYCE